MKFQREDEEPQNSKCASIFGFIIVLCGSILLFWNEGSAIKTSMALDEGLKYITVPQTIAVQYPENENKLVLVGGHLAIRNTLSDEAYGVSINAVKLKKIVEVFQWQENEHTNSHTIIGENGQKVTHDEKSYTYEQGWFDEHIDSTLFNSDYGYYNPTESVWPANSKTEMANDVKIGSFILGTALKNKISDFKPLKSNELPSSVWAWVTLHDGIYYHCTNLWQPSIGDYRVTFLYAGREGESFTIAGKQSGEEILPYQTVTGEQLFILQSGLKDAGEVFMSEQYNNWTWTWIIRVLGWLLTFIGLFVLSTILEQVLDPSTMSLVTLGLANLPFAVSISLTLTTVGFSWISYYPLVGASLLILGALPYTGQVSKMCVSPPDCKQK